MRPGQQWIEGQNLRGYSRGDFEDAFSRYLPSPPNEVARTLEPASGLGFSPSVRPPAETLPLGPKAAPGLDPSILAFGEQAEREAGEADPPGVLHQGTEPGLAGTRSELAGENDTPAEADLARVGGRGAFIWRVGEACAWQSYPYAARRAIASGRQAWARFVRSAPDEELSLAAEAMLRESAAGHTGAGTAYSSLDKRESA